MALTSLLDINLKKLIETLEEKIGEKLPKKVVSISLSENTLHIRFTHPKTIETDVEPLPLKTPIFLFRDEKTKEITALEIINIDEALRELNLKTIDKSSQ